LGGAEFVTNGKVVHFGLPAGGVVAALVLAAAIVLGAWRQVDEARTSVYLSADVSTAFRPELPSLQPNPLAPATTLRARVVIPDAAQSLADYFDSLSYRLGKVRAGETRVPRIYARRLPQNLGDMVEIERKKRVFIRAILPLILKVNEEVHAERRRLKALRGTLASGGSPSESETAWFRQTAQRYGLEDAVLDDTGLALLLKRVDEVPPSLALAQSIQESGWGTSRFARHGNALFGQRTWNGKHDGLQPQAVDEEANFRVRAFANLLSGIRSYVHNLNTHATYAQLRDQRADLRADGQKPNGHALAGTLTRYSEEGETYVRKLRGLIRSNELRALDDASLDPHSVARELALDPHADEVKVSYERGGTRN
jgi:Bax protein